MTSTKKVRYFFHGDRAGEDSFYCAMCDLFVAKVHFDAAHATENHYSKYLATRKPLTGKYYRPNSADDENIFH